MHATLVPPAELTSDDMRRWVALQTLQRGLDSPLLHPTYFQVLAEHRPHIEIARLGTGDETLGYFPFERRGTRVAHAAGGRLCDFQAVIVDPASEWNANELLNACGLRAWHMQPLLVGQPQLQAFHQNVDDSWYLDLTGGYDVYLDERQQAGTAQVRQTARKRRKLAREVGEIRFEWHTTSASAFEQLLQWKHEQRVRTRTFDVLQYDWVVRTLDQLRATDTPGFSGVMSTLYAGDTIAAVHLGVRTDRVLHHWFPAFNRDLYKYSPGLIHLLDMAKEASSLGIERIDVGRGNFEWKRCFASGSIPVASGVADTSRLTHALRSAWSQTLEVVKRSPLRKPLLIPKRLIRPLQNRLVMR